MTKKDTFSIFKDIIMIVTVIIALIVFTVGSCYDQNLKVNKEIALIDGVIAELKLNDQGIVKQLIDNEESYSKGINAPTLRGVTILLEESIKSGVIRNEKLLRGLIVLQSNYNDVAHNLDKFDEEAIIKHLDNDEIELSKLLAIESIKNAITHAKVIRDNFIIIEDELNKYKNKLNKSRPWYCKSWISNNQKTRK